MTKEMIGNVERESSTARLVVVGHGPTAHRLVDTLRTRDTAGKWHITIIGEETRPAYNRVALTSHLEGEELAYPPHDPAVTLLTGERVLGIDRDGKKVTTQSGKSVEYDSLVLAT